MEHTAGANEMTTDRYGRIWGPVDPRSKHANGRVLLAEMVDDAGKHHPNLDNGSIDEEARATAILFSASKEMLDACKEIVTTLEPLVGSETPEQWLYVLTLAKRAIAKAEGR